MFDLTKDINDLFVTNDSRPSEIDSATIDALVNQCVDQVAGDTDTARAIVDVASAYADVTCAIDITAAEAVDTELRAVREDVLRRLFDGPLSGAFREVVNARLRKEATVAFVKLALQGQINAINDLARERRAVDEDQRALNDMRGTYAEWRSAGYIPVALPTINLRKERQLIDLGGGVTAQVITNRPSPRTGRRASMLFILKWNEQLLSVRSFKQENLHVCMDIIRARLAEVGFILPSL